MSFLGLLCLHSKGGELLAHDPFCFAQLSSSNEGWFSQISFVFRQEGREDNAVDQHDICVPVN
jgi:hypothetical protein